MTNLKINKFLEVPIVLTGTIHPRAIMTVHVNPEQRKNEYLNALEYYSTHSKVFFIENSGFNFREDPDFSLLSNVIFISVKPSDEYNKGKGYQEFLMLDEWFDLYGAHYTGFLKITGRYIIKNIKQILNDSQKSVGTQSIFERKLGSLNVALTDLFFSGNEFYKENIYGCYKNADDSTNQFIELVVGGILRTNNNVRVFSKYPIKIGINGSLGIKLPSGKIRKVLLSIRNLIYLFVKRYRLI